MKLPISLTLILLLGLILRIYDVSNNPPALYGDELTIILDAYSILKTGQDQTGAFLPLTFSMGAGRPAGYVYSSIPFVALFGPSELGVRFLSVLSGIGIIILLYFISEKIFSKKVGILAALITSVTPWGISLSRGGFEANFALFLALLGVYCFLLRRPFTYLFSALSFGLTLHTYPTFKLTLPLLVSILIWYQGIPKNISQLKEKIYLLVSILILVLLGFLAIVQTFNGGSEERFSNINIFAQDELNQKIEQKVNFERSISNFNTDFSKYFHNKPVEYIKVWIENYLQNYSLDFLILHGDGNPRHNMATMGVIYLSQAILFLIGLITFWFRQRKALIMLLLWLIIAPLPTSIIGAPHALRSLFMLPPLIIISALGLTLLIEQKRRVFLASLSLIFLIQFIFFIQKLFFLSPNQYSRFWSYPAKMASKIALDNKDQFSYIILSDKIDNIEFAYPVYGLIEPIQVINQNKNRSKLEKYQLKKFNNVYIGYIPEDEITDLVNSLDGKVLFISTQDTAKFLNNFETIDGLDKMKVLSLTKKQK